MLESCLLKIRRAAWKGLMYVDFFAKSELEKVVAEYPKVLSLEDTLDRLVAGESICRFGDGEFSIILGRKQHFQNHSGQLAFRLSEVLSSPEEKNLLIAIPSLELDRETTREKEKGRKYRFWSRFWMRSWRFLKDYFTQSEYGNAFVSRLNVFQEVPLDKIKAIWENRDVVFIVPPNGRFKFDDRLFGNIKSAEFVDVPPVDAFEHYDEILDETLKRDKDKLYYIAAGPTATVLAYDLYRSGRQALDLGHLTNCYLEFLGVGKRPELLPTAIKSE